MNPEISLIFSVMTLIITLGGLLLGYFGVILKLSERLTKVETQNELFWCIVEKEVPRLLRHPDLPRKDELLDKMCEGNLSSSEQKELRNILKEELEVTTDKGEKLAQVLVLARLESVLLKKNGGEKK